MELYFLLIPFAILMAIIDNINDQMLNATEFVINYTYFYKVGTLNTNLFLKKYMLSINSNSY